MWDLLSMKAKSTIVALFTAIFVLAYPLLNIGFPDVKYEIATVNSISKFVSLLTGYWTFIYLFFRFFGMSLWSMPGISRILNKYVGPDLRGGWTADFQFKGVDGQSQSKILRFEITMSVFHFAMSMTSDDEYSTSHVVLSRILKDEVFGSYVLYYVFESEVVKPVETDVSTFQGSAKLRVKSGAVLTGTYWTNRNWQNRMQTAGCIKLVRNV
ncbi:hypothetical protein [Pseudomonas caspiana]|uniref:CD-NTase-associated protein 15 domain-containing protein n=1 Tax=Pseudomonas caspiana TaxID=1451454 RepID=A0A1Y3PA80_9PSED|nr:hypothetical protein [Pseudomonas caspiana]OUM74473.1 hypothetical protein AUC60_06910 [Pseudomonas caspiana]